ncbi:MAG: hypothetical protein NTW54_02595 [Bacteroidetes bacterium]|nr:hypothetical protein [Bacteroidota bacterium]
MIHNGIRLVVLVAILLCGSILKAQVIKGISPEDMDSLQNLEIQMQGQSEQIIESADYSTRKTSCYSLIRNLVIALNLPGSFNYPFDSLKQISIVKSPDDKFRIFTWNLRNNDDSYRFYGAIQRNEKKGVMLIPLFDAGPLIKRPEDTTVDNNYWWGALYYKILPGKVKNETCYTLLGWNGANNKSNKKVIEVLRFQEGSVVFGAPIFKAGANDIMNRVVFEYNNEVQNMVLTYEPVKKYIVFDHLAPITPKAIGRYELYYPDGSYDYFVFENGYWNLKEMLFDNGTIKTLNDNIEQRTKKGKQD